MREPRSVSVREESILPATVLSEQRLEYKAKLAVIRPMTDLADRGDAVGCD